MTLTAKEVAEITRLLEESSFDELYLELDGVKLSLRRGAASAGRTAGGEPQGARAAAPRAEAAAGTRAALQGTAGPTSGGSAGMASPGPAHGAPTAAAPESRPGASVPEGDPNTQEVPAPLLGTFYRAPKPGAPPFIEVGAQVEEETIVGIIEVMKLMNTVRAGVRGRVTEIVARDGALVEYGETLLRVSKTE